MWTRMRNTYRRYVGDKIYFEYHELLHPFINACNPQMDASTSLLIVAGERIVLQELLFLLHLLPRQHRDIFLLGFEGSPMFHSNFAEGMPLYRQWTPPDPACLNTMVDWLRLNVARIGGPALRHQMSHSMWTDEKQVQNAIFRQLEIEKFRNPHLYELWFSQRAQTPLQSQHVEPTNIRALPVPEKSPPRTQGPAREPEKVAKAEPLPEEPAKKLPRENTDSLLLKENPNVDDMSVRENFSIVKINFKSSSTAWTISRRFSGDLRRWRRISWTKWKSSLPRYTIKFSTRRSWNERSRTSRKNMTRFPLR
jgi:hypothetical protein